MEDTIIEDVLKTFENLYLKQDYPNALLSLKNHKSEMEVGTWHYNMGTVMAQMQRLSEARYHLMMASRSGFSSEGLSLNLKLVEEKLDTARLEEATSTSDYLIKTSLVVSDGILTTISLLILLVGLWVLRRKADAKKILVFLVLVLLPISINLWVKSWPKAIVLAPQSINDGPSVIFGTNNELPAGVMLVLKKNEDEDWEEIIFPSRFRGWVKKNGLLELE